MSMTPIEGGEMSNNEQENIAQFIEGDPGDECQCEECTQ